MEQHTPALVMFVQAVMAFKRLARTLKKWKTLERTTKVVHSRGPNSLLLQVRKTNLNVKQASSGFHVIQVTANDIAETRKEIKTHRVLAEREKRRKENEDALDKQKKEQEDMVNGNNFAKYMVRSKIKEFGQHLTQMQHEFDRELFKTMDEVDPDGHWAQNAETLGMLNKVAQDKKKKVVSVEDKKNEKIEYLAGTTIYFGSTVAVQGRHGGYLSYHTDVVKASAPRCCRTRSTW